ncbi:GNAT family N-acetyltransferase [Mycolicibacterium mucogenicum]|uniref:GNAT family N-acetyltransferase n=1 Tax=Mycolicibacterium mucogenicum TaxID=56689 RepID=UPI001F374F70|nr:GNAT family N-acetyltransferase [Mycolicibacterium mucogenicum]
MTLREGPGCYVATATDSDNMLGTVTLSRRRNDVPGHLDRDGDELELSYVFRPHAWGQGYASEASGYCWSTRPASWTIKPW